MATKTILREKTTIPMLTTGLISISRIFPFLGRTNPGGGEGG